ERLAPNERLEGRPDLRPARVVPEALLSEVVREAHRHVLEHAGGVLGQRPATGGVAKPPQAGGHRLPVALAKTLVEQRVSDHRIAVIRVPAGYRVPKPAVLVLAPGPRRRDLAGQGPRERPDVVRPARGRRGGHERDQDREEEGRTEPAEARRSGGHDARK